MFRLVKRNLMDFVSPVDPRTVFFFVGCAVAFYMGIRFEHVDTLKVEKEFVTYKLEQSVLLAQTQQQVLNEAVAAQAAIQEVNENASIREAELTVQHNDLLSRFNAERLRRQTLATELSKASTASTTSKCDAKVTGPDLFGKAGEDIISLTHEADKYLNGFKDCQAYVKVISQACK